MEICRALLESYKKKGEESRRFSRWNSRNNTKKSTVKNKGRKLAINPEMREARLEVSLKELQLPDSSTSP